MTYRKKSFIDHTCIHVRPGNGGNGCVSFDRSSHGVICSADGGHGGKGGCVFVVGSNAIYDLSKLLRGRCYRAGDGGNGGSQKKNGKNGDDLIITVPIGSEIYDQDRKLLFEITDQSDRFLLAKGANKGLGNSAFVNSHNPRANKATLGAKSEQIKIYIELKIIADLSLVGFPNAGKSMLLRALTAATPEVDAYPFTTLNPQLGVISSWEMFSSFDDDYIEQSIVIADIPGLIIGASEGVGLGVGFLKHIEKTSMIAMVIKITGNPNDLVDKFNQLLLELSRFSSKLLNTEKVVIISQVDSCDENVDIESYVLSIRSNLQARYKNILEVITVSSLTGVGIDQLKTMLITFVDRIKKQKPLHSISNNNEHDNQSIVINDGHKTNEHNKQLLDSRSCLDYLQSICDPNPVIEVIDQDSE